MRDNLIGKDHLSIRSGLEPREDMSLQPETTGQSHVFSFLYTGQMKPLDILSSSSPNNNENYFRNQSSMFFCVVMLVRMKTGNTKDPDFIQCFNQFQYNHLLGLHNICVKAISD